MKDGFVTADCPFPGCSSGSPGFPVFCISLEDQPARYEACRRHLHDVGLCRHVIWYRPRRAAEPWRGCWESHAAVARYCLAQRIERALILEDDVHFHTHWNRIGPRVSRAVAQLPETWRGLYLGHQPRKAHFVGQGLLQTLSLAMHAYLANRPLLAWLGTTTPFDARIPFRHGVFAIDGAMVEMEGMYALFPMVATQRSTGESFHARRLEEAIVPLRMRSAELLAAALSPWHRRTWPAAREAAPYVRDTELARQARQILAEGWFDEEAYMAANPDVARARTSGLRHYIEHGRAEGRPLRVRSDREDT